MTIYPSFNLSGLSSLLWFAAKLLVYLILAMISTDPVVIFTSSFSMKFSGFGKIFILFSLLLVVFAFFELAFRSFIFPDWRVISRVRFEQHPIFNTFQKPNLSVRRYNPPNYDVINSTNSMGFRDRQKGFQTDLNRIWIAGMSNSYGGFVNDSEVYAHRLEETHQYRNALLASEGHVLSNQVSVMRYLHRQGYKPQLILLELTLNNVLRDYEEGISN